MTATKKPKSQQNKIKLYFKNLIAGLLITIGVLAHVVIIVGGITVFYILRTSPDLDPNKLTLTQSPQIFDMKGELLTTLLSAENRRSASIDEMPQILKDAVVCLEDSRFYEHPGIDLRRIGGAIVSNITNGFGSQGASTITQQVVKNLFLTNDKTWTRKIQEQYLALQLDDEYSKDKILETYLNAIYYSDSRYGVLEASDYYFSKELSQLSIEDAALLAAIPQRPNYFNPFNNPEEVQTRRNMVIDLLLSKDKITSQEAELAKSIPVVDQLHKSQREVYPYQAFLDQVLNELETSGLESSDIYTKGLKVYTTLDQNLQQYVEHVMQSGEVVQFPDDKFQAGITVMDTKTGRVLAIGGSRDSSAGVRTWNWAVNPRRSPGSAIKPILDYGPAVDELKWSTYHQLVDEPHTYTNGIAINNFDNKYIGKISLRKAMETSRNVPAVKAFQEVGQTAAKAFGERLGIELDDIEEAYSIGGFKTGVSSFQMAGAYGAFGNNGVYNAPHTVTKVVFPDGKVIDLEPKKVVAMNDYTAFIITNIMRTVVEGTEGTGKLAAVPGIQIAGKTGSSNFTAEEKEQYNISSGIKDSWFVGYSTEFTTSVWTGYANNADGHLDTSSGSTDGKIARYLFKEIMTYAHTDIDTADFEQPDSVIRIGIDKSTGLLPGKSFRNRQTIYEYFVVGTEPTKETKKVEKKDEDDDEDEEESPPKKNNKR